MVTSGRTITVFECPVVPETSSSLVSITFCGFFFALVCDCGVVGGGAHPGASVSAVSAWKAVRGFDVSGQLSSA